MKKKSTIVAALTSAAVGGGIATASIAQACGNTPPSGLSSEDIVQSALIALSETAVIPNPTSNQGVIFRTILENLQTNNESDIQNINSINVLTPVSSITINRTENTVVGNIVEKLDVNNENINKTSVFVSILKPKRFNYLIQKASELGVNDIFPVISERTVTKFNSEKEKEKKIKQWRWIAKEAAEQSERNYIPRIHSIKTIDEIKPGPSANYLADTKLRTTMTKNIQTVDETCCVFGPEGGFSSNEIEILHEKGFSSISLGKRILRSETAPVVFLTLFL